MPAVVDSFHAVTSLWGTVQQPGLTVPSTPVPAPIPFGHLRRNRLQFTAFLPHGLGGGPLRPCSSFPWSPFLLGPWIREGSL